MVKVVGACIGSFQMLPFVSLLSCCHEPYVAVLGCLSVALIAVDALPFSPMSSLLLHPLEGWMLFRKELIHWPGWDISLW